MLSITRKWRQGGRVWSVFAKTRSVYRHALCMDTQARRLTATSWQAMPRIEPSSSRLFTVNAAGISTGPSRNAPCPATLLHCPSGPANETSVAGWTARVAGAGPTGSPGCRSFDVDLQHTLGKPGLRETLQTRPPYRSTEFASNWSYNRAYSARWNDVL
jgi:hypothetical protein